MQLFDTSLILQPIFCCLFLFIFLTLGIKIYGNKLNIFVSAVSIQTINSQQRSEQGKKRLNLLALDNIFELRFRKKLDFFFLFLVLENIHNYPKWVMLLFLFHLKTQIEIFYVNILSPLNNNNFCLSPDSNLIKTK